jgi:hypothetical protein
MIATEAKTIVTQCIAQAVERMAFLDVLPFQETPPVPAEFALAEIRFKGAVSGCIQVAAGLDFACELAGCMGLMEHPSEFQCLDALKELVNVTCGLVLPLLATPDADVFEMSIPQAVPCGESADWNRWIQQDDVALLDIGGYPVAARLNLNA